MGKKGHKNEGQKKKLTKKEKKRMNHLKLVENKKSRSESEVEIERKKAA